MIASPWPLSEIVHVYLPESAKCILSIQPSLTTCLVCGTTTVSVIPAGRSATPSLAHVNIATKLVATHEILGATSPLSAITCTYAVDNSPVSSFITNLAGLSTSVTKNNYYELRAGKLLIVHGYIPIRVLPSFRHVFTTPNHVLSGAFYSYMLLDSYTLTCAHIETYTRTENSRLHATHNYEEVKSNKLYSYPVLRSCAGAIIMRMHVIIIIFTYQLE